MSNRYNQIIEQIQAGIEAELADTPQFFEYRIVAIEKEGEIWKVHVDLTDEGSRGLDESLEGSSAWWAGPPNGGADVLSVIPENEQVNLRFATNTPPGSVKLIRLYPPRYLEALQSCWSDHN